MTETYRPGDFAVIDGALHVLDGGGYFTSIETGEVVIPDESTSCGPVLGNVADIATLTDGPAPESGDVSSEQRYINLLSNASRVLAERDQLARWKEEALPVISGLQELGRALHIRPGERITGPAALEAVQKLRGAAQAFLDAYDAVGNEVWWPDEVEPLREVLERG